MIKWIIAGLVLLLISIIFDMGLLLYAVYAIAAVLLISRWVTRTWAEELHAERHCDRVQVDEGETVTVMIQVENKGWLPIAWCLIEDLLPADALFWKPPRLAVTGKRIALLRLKKGERQQLMYQFRCNRRGYYQIGPLVMETGDFFGLHRRFRVASQPQFVTVLPSTLPLDGYDVASKRPIGEVKMTYRIFEDPTRIAGVRKYEMGDPMNRVNWRATARTGELHSKVYEPSTIAGATLLLDFHTRSFAQKNEPYRSELAIKTTASLANAVYDMGQQFGLVTNGRDAVDRIRAEGWAADARTRDEARESAQMVSENDRLRPQIIPTRRGSDQLMLILEALARLELTDGLDLPQLILESGSRLPRDTTLIPILTSVSAETAIALGTLARQGYSVSAIINVHSIDEFAAASGPLLNEGIETRHLRDEASIRDICRAQTLLLT